MIQRTENKTELLKAITFYQERGERQKLQALYYLIDNMSLKSHLDGPEIEQYDSLLKELSDFPADDTRTLDNTFDSLKAAKKLVFPGNLSLVNDLETIKGTDLIQHIDAAFTAWSYPWARSLSFEEFRHYLLPIKLVKEKPRLWNRIIQLRYEALAMSLETVDDPYEVCLVINNQLKRDFKITSIPSFWDLTFEELDRLRSGKCYHATQYTAYVMRSLGLRIEMDFTPYWGNRNGGHEWNALIHKGKPIPFVGSESDPGKTKIDLAFRRKRAKVFRRTFKPEESSLWYQVRGTEDVPSLFRDYFLKDVTREYMPVTDVVINLNEDSQQFRHAFLCVFNSQEWKPLHWAAIDDRRVSFNDMGRGIVYLPAYYREGTLIPAGAPVILKQDGTMEALKGNGEHQSVAVRKKSPEGPSIIKGKTYELLYWQDGWRSVGTKVAEGDSVVFAHVPKHSLLWVKSEDKRTNERIFVYKDKQQIWW